MGLPVIVKLFRQTPEHGLKVFTFYEEKRGEILDSRHLAPHPNSGGTSTTYEGRPTPPD